MEADPITEGDNIKEIESDIFMLAGHLAMNEVYDAYKFICIGKSFGIRSSTITKSRTDQKVIWRQLFYNKEGHKSRDKRQER